jgi:hypothetical protein
MSKGALLSTTIGSLVKVHVSGIVLCNLQLCEAKGIKFIMETSLAELRGLERVQEVVLNNGLTLPAETVIFGAGNSTLFCRTILCLIQASFRRLISFVDQRLRWTCAGS